MEMGQPPVHHRIWQRHGCHGDSVAESTVSDCGLVPRVLLFPFQKLRLLRLGHLRRKDFEDAPTQHQIDYRPTDAATEVFEDIQNRIGEQLAAFDRLLANDLPAFNTRLAEAKLDAVLVT